MADLRETMRTWMREAGVDSADVARWADAPADAALDEASRLRAKEQADHKAWLRDNAASVIVPEHPAVTLLREVRWDGGRCLGCGSRGPEEGCASGCRIAAILAGSKPGERALSDLLAEERAEEREACAQVAIAEAQREESDVDTAQRILLAIRARGGAS